MNTRLRLFYPLVSESIKNVRYQNRNNSNNGLLFGLSSRRPNSKPAQLVTACLYTIYPFRDTSRTDVLLFHFFSCMGVCVCVGLFFFHSHRFVDLKLPCSLFLQLCAM